MSKVEMLFGYKDLSLGEVVASLEKKIDAKFSEHDSFYMGGVYFAHVYSDGESILVQRNLELEDELAEEEFPDYSLLIYVGSTHRPDYWKGVILNTRQRVKILRQELR